MGSDYGSRRPESLIDKWKASYANRNSDPIVPYYMNLCFPPWYLFTIISVWYYGFFTVLPYVYGDSTGLLGHQVFSTFVLLEMMANWLCICFVDSTFGTPPGTRGGRPRTGKPGCVEEDDRHMSEPLAQTMVHRNEETDSSPQKSSVENPNYATKYYRASDGSVIVSMPTGTPQNGEEPSRTNYPYFSWKPCLICNRMRPPRCHHCPLCQKCVLKRDHHCYFAGSCIGLYNQRHFIVFTFWASVATVYAFLHSLPYIYFDLLPQTSYVDFVLPLTYLRFVFGYASLKLCVLMTMEWSLICFVLFSIFFFVEQILLVSRSLTTFENESAVNLRDSRDRSGRLIAVFGQNWTLNFLVPLHMFYDPEEDALHWPHIIS